MVIRMVEFSLGAGRLSAALGVAGQVITAIRAQEGIERAEFYGDEASGEYGFFALWQTKQAAEAAFPVIFPILSAALTAAGAIGEPRIRTQPVFEIKQPGLLE